MEYKEFRIGDLFEVKKGKRLTQANMIPGTIKFVGATSENNGETARIWNTKYLHAANTITVTYNGSVGEVFYQDEPFWASDDVNVLYPKFEMTVQQALYIMTAIQRLRGKYSYTHKWVKEFLENDMILLPVATSGKPDYAYMRERISELERERISELERERISELERYLKVTGLEDFELTEEDKAVLQKPVSYKEFPLGDLLEVKSPRRRFNANSVAVLSKRTAQAHPYIVRTSENNGQRGYIEQDEEYLSEARTFSFGQDTATVFFQTEAYFTGDKIKVMSLKDKTIVLSEEIACYMVTQIRKAFSMFLWGQSSFDEKVLLSTNIILPTTSGKIPDYDYMGKYIRAQEKLAIKDVVMLKDRIIQETLQIVCPIEK